MIHPPKYVNDTKLIKYSGMHTTILRLYYLTERETIGDITGSVFT